MPQHYVVTGPIAGRIPTPDSRVPHDQVDVTPDVIICPDEEIGAGLLASIDQAHRDRGSHPDQVQQVQAPQPEATVVMLGA